VANGVKTTISVREMGRLLGLKKVESYYLVHKGYFKTILVEGKKRILLDSFEKWYAGQSKYKKAAGSDDKEVEPDDEKKLYLTVREAAEMSGYPLTEIQNWIRRGKLRPVKFGSKVIRIKKSDLDQFLSEIGGKNGWLH
jgi:excisionase family DNA binding protein